ncbi:MAG: hypothetical protein MZW92_18190 [Comamonadaceae bacterium]|nr:hypothetical protein [Comamonadaceae bacterium]
MLTTDADDAEAVERFLERSALTSRGETQLRIVPGGSGREAAYRRHLSAIIRRSPPPTPALRDLPAALRMKGAYPRQVRRLR